MKSNKGMTIVEILISVCIIALVLTLLFALLIQVRNEESSNSIQSNFLMNQSTFIKQIEEDIVNYGVKAVTACDLGATGTTSESITMGHENDYKCIKIHFAADYVKDNVGIILVYNTYKHYGYEDGKYVGKDPTWSISYQRGNYNECNARGVPILSKWKNASGILSKEIPSEVDLSDKPYVSYTASSGDNITNAASLVIPIVNLEGEHYDINLAFTFKGNRNFVCSEDVNRLDCVCTSESYLCNSTIIKADAGVGDITIDDAKICAIKKHLCPSYTCN